MSAGNLSLYRKNAGKAANARIMRRLMTAASISALVIAAPAVIISPAAAEPVPAGCTDSSGDGEIGDNETITCISASTVSEISSTFTSTDPGQDAADLTIVIGDTTTPTNVASGSGENYGVLLRAGGSVYVNNAASTVSGFYNGIRVSTENYHTNGITIESEGTISGGTGVGIRIGHSGYSDTVINVADVSGGAGGIRAENYRVFANDLSITSTGTVSATGGTGIRTVNASVAGSTYINVVDVSGGGTTGHGIYATNDGVDLTVISSGSVYGVSNGVSANNYGSGDTSVSVNTITSVAGNGVAVEHEGADLTVSSNGTITAAYDGILLNQRGTGATSISVDTIDAGRDGVFIETAATATGDVSVTATGAVTAGQNGVVLSHDGTGATSISVDTINANAFGVFLNVDAAATGDVSLTATGAISSATRDGVWARQYGAGSIAFTLTDVDAGPSSTRDGVDVINDGADIDIVSTGMIEAGGDGIWAINRGTGATRISVRDINVNSEGIRVRSDASTTGEVSVTAAGTIASGRDGVYVQQNGTGATSINVADVSVSGAVEHGILVTHDGADLSVVSTGTITSAGGAGVFATSYASGVTDISVNNVSAASQAILLFSYGGDVSISATGALSSQSDAVVADQYGAGGVSVAANTVTANRRAIDITAYATSVGDISVTAAGAVNAGDDGVVIDNRGSGNTSVSVADVTAGSGGGDNGVQVLHTGADLTVVSTGTISAGNAGVSTDHRGTGDTTISVNSIDAGTSGIEAFINDTGSSGDVVVTATGQIDAGSVGVGAINLGTGGVDISVNAVDAANNAVFIYAAIGGSGDVNLTATGAVVSQDYDTIVVYQYGDGDTTINVADVTAAYLESNAVTIDHRGGDLSLTSTGVISSAGYGVKAYNTGTGDTTISVGSVAADYGAGILAQNQHAGALSITASGAIAAYAVDGDYAGVGVWAGAQAGGDVTVDVADVYGQTYGVRVQSTGGAVNVTAEDVSGYYNAGVRVNQSAGGGDVFVTTTGAVTSAEGIGVYVSNSGTGATAVSVNSIVSANGGINAYSSASAVGSDVTVTASGAIEAGDYGIFASTSGYGGVNISASDIDAGARGILAVAFAGSTGDINVTTSGAVVAQDRNAIGVFNSGSGDTIIDINDATAVAAYAALSVLHAGGELSVNAAGTLTSGGDGVTVFGLGTGPTTINVNNINAEDNALEITQSAGGGAVSVTATGTVAAANGDGVGILRDGPSLADVTVSVAHVTAGDNGVDVVNNNGGVNITVAGAVTGGGGEGILSSSTDGTFVTVADGGSVSGVDAAIRMDGDADDGLTLMSGGSIGGDVLLQGGDDVFNDAGGQFTTVFGGDGTDTVNFEAGGARTISGSGGAEDALQDFEVFNFNAGGFTLAGAHTGLAETNFNAGVNTLTGTLTSTETTVAEGATLNKADGSVINGLLTVDGTLSIGNSPGVSTIDGDVVFGPASVLPIETLGDAHDTLIVTGSVTLDGEIQIIHLGDLEVGTTRRTIIDGDRDIIGSHATVSSEEGLLISNSVDFDPSGFDLILTTTVNSALSVDGLTGDELSLGEHLVGLLGQPSLDPELAGVINAVGAVPEVDNLSAVLAELRPEGFDGGLRFLANAQGRFMSNMIDVPAHAARRAGPNGAHIWGAIELSHLSKSDEPRHVGFEGDAYELSAGVSGIGRGPLRFGLAGGYARFEGDTKAGVTDAIDVSLYRLAASARIDMDGAGANGHIDTVVSFAKGENELEMRLIDPVSDAQITQSGQADISSIGFATRFTMTGADGRQWLIRPHAEIGLDAVRQDAVDVRGAEAGATALAVEKLDSTRAHIALGAAFDRDVGKSLSLNASVEGVRYFSDTENVIEARFAAAPDDVPAFRTIGANVEWQARMRAGASYAHKSGFVLSADAFGEAGDLTAYGARIELLRRF